MLRIDLSPLLKASARLLDLHDSRRSPGESTQYQSEERSGHGDGRYFAIASTVLSVLQDYGKRSGDEFSSSAAISQAVQEHLAWANGTEIEYTLNVLSRPSELKLLHTDGDGGSDSHVIGDKETNLIDKAAHISEFRLSKIGKTALVMAMDNMDIAYIEGDVIKLTRALESGRLTQALGFVDRLIDQLRSEHLALITLIERTSGGRRARPETIDDLESYAATMSRAVELVNTAQSRVDDLVRGEMPLPDDVPLGLIRERVLELSRGIVRYARDVALLAIQTLSATWTNVKAPSFSDLALRWVKTSPTKTQLDTILGVLGPAFPFVMTPLGTDYAGIVKVQANKQQRAAQVDLGEFELPVEHQFIEWLRRNQAMLDGNIQNAGLSVHDAIEQGLADLDGNNALGCLVAALTSPEEWVGEGVQAKLNTELRISTTPGLAVMYTHLQLNKPVPAGPDQEIK